MKLLIRIYLGSKGEELIKSDTRLSKANYDSRKNYSIKTAILKKRSIYDSSILSMKHTIYNSMNLQSYYNRQLPNIRSIIEESVGHNRQVVKLFTKVIPA